MGKATSCARANRDLSRRRAREEWLRDFSRERSGRLVKDNQVLRECGLISRIREECNRERSDSGRENGCRSGTFGNTAELSETMSVGKPVAIHMTDRLTALGGRVPIKHNTEESIDAGCEERPLRDPSNWRRSMP